MSHRNARLTPNGRRIIIERILGGRWLMWSRKWACPRTGGLAHPVASTGRHTMIGPRNHNSGAAHLGLLTIGPTCQPAPQDQRDNLIASSRCIAMALLPRWPKVVLWLPSEKSSLRSGNHSGDRRRLTATVQS